MSRVAKNPVLIPAGVEIKLDGNHVTVKGAKATLSIDLNEKVDVKIDDGKVIVIGVTTGFQKKLELIGVGYRAKASGNSLNLTLGFSHPIDFDLPEGVTVETPTQTEIIVRGANKQAVGEIAAKIRAFRPPEPYKGKGIRYSDEHVLRKEAKKK